MVKMDCSSMVGTIKLRRLWGIVVESTLDQPGDYALRAATTDELELHTVPCGHVHLQWHGCQGRSHNCDLVMGSCILPPTGLQ